MKNLFRLASILSPLLGALSSAASAADIDAFTSFAPETGVRPNILFIVDNTANWSQSANSTDKFTAEKAGLSGVFNNLKLGTNGAALFNIGVLMAVETGNPNNNTDGGYVRAAIRAMDTNTRTKYGTMISTLDINNDKGNNGSAGLWMAEAYRYFSAGAPIGGTGKVKADYLGNTGSTWKNGTYTAAELSAMQAIYGLTGTYSGSYNGNALTSSGAANYHLPPTPGGNLTDCPVRTYIIYISNGPAQDNASATTTATDALTAAGGDTTAIPLNPTGSQPVMADEWARFMRQKSPLGVITYTVDVIPGTTGQGPGWTALLKSMASVSSGQYIPINSISSGGTEISDAINKILAEINAKTSTFASVSLPASISTQSSYLNQVYIGMFRPDQDANPRWYGNMKQFKLGLVGSDLKLLDADTIEAINTTTGYIKGCSRSFWTPSTTDSYWTFQPDGNCDVPPAGQASDYYYKSNFPDGSSAQKGAAAHMLRQITVANRNLKTCPPIGSPCTLANFDTSNGNITQALLDSTNTVPKNTLVNWLRGSDLKDEDEDNNTTEARPSIHGDVVHSQPLAINMGTDASPKIVVFYGANDGVFHAINGNRTDPIGTTAAGQELWGFVPPEFYGNIKRLYDNTQQVSFPNVTGGGPKPYGLDGPVSGMLIGGKQYIYAIQRRGGRSLYAFTASMDDFGNLSMNLAWRAGCNSTTCTDNNFADIGQTWAKPVATKVSGQTNPALIVTGGHDDCEDADPASCTGIKKGRALYVLDAKTGEILKSFDSTVIDRAIIGGITLVQDSSGNIQYGYTADLGGNVYRLTATGSVGSWTLTKIASLGCDSGASCSPNRKFTFAPDVAIQNGITYLLLGSGDREKPTYATSSSYGMQNYFYMIEDKPGDSSWYSGLPIGCTVVCANALLTVTAGQTLSANALNGKYGWKLALDVSKGEFVATSAITAFGTVYFSTYEPYQPDSATCGNHLGETAVYQVNFLGSGAIRSKIKAEVGLPPSPTVGQVKLDDGVTIVPFCIGCNSDSELQSQLLTTVTGTTITRPKSRTYWVIKQ